MKPEDQGALLHKLAQPDANKLALTENRKASPPSMDVAPVSTVDERKHGDMHWHSGASMDPFPAARAGLPYKHQHIHSHPVVHDPDNPGTEIHDTKGHFALHKYLSSPEQKAAIAGLAKAFKAARMDSPGQEEIRNATISLLYGMDDASIQKSASPAGLAHLRDLARKAALVDSEDWQLRGIGRNAQRELDVQISRLAPRATPKSAVLPDTVKAVIERSIGDLVERLKRLESRQ